MAMNRLVAVVVLSLLTATFFIDAEARRFRRGKDPCPRAERNLNIRCGHHISGQCPGSSYCFRSRARPIATCCCKDTAATCPDCTQPVNCVIDPCEVTACPAFPNATCRADFCGGCNARFFIQRQEVTDQCNEIAPCSRYGGRDISINCGRGTTGECPGGSYCDIHPTDVFATCCCNDTAATCPDCTQPVSCVIDPCEVTSCPAFPNATCRADFCGGCNARFFFRRQEVTERCNEQR